MEDQQTKWWEQIWGQAKIKNKKNTWGQADTTWDLKKGDKTSLWANGRSAFTMLSLKEGKKTWYWVNEGLSVTKLEVQWVKKHYAMGKWGSTKIIMDTGLIGVINSWVI